MLFQALLFLVFQHVHATISLSSTTLSTSVLWSNSSSSSITSTDTLAHQTYSISSSNLSPDPASLSSASPSQTDGTARSSASGFSDGLNSSSTLPSNGTISPLNSIAIPTSSGSSSIITSSSSTVNTLLSVLPGSSTTINKPTASIDGSTTSNTAWLALVTSTVTTAPPNLETLISTNSEWTANTWLTTSRPGDQSSTIVPVLVGCPGCGGLNGGIIIFNLPAIPHVSFQLPKLPGLPKFHLPCIKVFGVTVAGDCNDPPQTDDDSEPKSSATQEPTHTETQSQSQSVSESSSEPSSSSTSSSSSSASSSCFLNPYTSVLGAQWSPNDAASSSMSSEYSAPEYALMYSRYSLQGWFPPPPSTASTITSSIASSIASSSAQPGSAFTTSLSSTSTSASNALASSTDASSTTSSQLTTLETSTVRASTTLESSSSLLTRSSTALPRLTTTQCLDSTLINCHWIFNPATACPTTTEALPASCTETATPTLLTTSTPVLTSATSSSPTPTIYVLIAFQQYNYEGETGGNQWNLYAQKPKQSLYWCDDSIDSLGDDKIKATDTVDVKSLPWPSGTFKFPSKHGVDDCIYTGTQAAPGQVACPGKKEVTCVADPLVGTTVLCDPDLDGGSDMIYPKVVCYFV